MPRAGPQAARPRLAYEHPHDSELHRYAEGECVRHYDGDGRRAGRIVRTLDHEGLVEIDFGHEGTAVVGIEEIEPERA